MQHLESLGEITVAQSTPIRVLHRRAAMVRNKTVSDMQTELLSDHFFTLRMTTSAGAYVKEFVHGDLGRTVPSIGSLLHCQADILQLDVLGIDDDKLKATENSTQEVVAEMAD